MSFQDDIQGKNTVLYPVVIFETSATAAGDVQISTKPVTIVNRTFDPLLISSPSINESIDLEDRKYQISNVSLKISNVPYNGERFSNRISLHEFGGALNTQAAIYWISPSVENEPIAFQDDELNAAYFAYKGTIRKISHDEKMCSITLEDISQATFHSKVPVNILTGDNVLEKYKNKPYPMVYGDVDKSPLVIGNINIDANSEYSEDGVMASDAYNLFLDIDETVISDEDIEDSPLLGFKSSYVKMKSTYDSLSADKFGYDFASIQYSVDSNIITLHSSVTSTGEAEEVPEDQEGSTPVNSIAQNEIVGYDLVKPTSYKPNRTDWTPSSNYIKQFLTASSNIEEIVWGDYAPIGWDDYRFAKKFHSSIVKELWPTGSHWGEESLIDSDDIWFDSSDAEYHEVIPAILFSGANIQADEEYGIIRSHFTIDLSNHSDYADDGLINALKIRFGANTDGDYGSGIWYSYSIPSSPVHPAWTDFQENVFEHNSYNPPGYNYLPDPPDSPVVINNPKELSFYVRLYGGIGEAGVHINFLFLELDHYLKFEGMLDIDYYASRVEGRTD